MNIVEFAQKMNDVELVQMTFDPELSVDVCDLILVMANDPTKRKLTEDQWEEAKEHCVDVMEQFLELRHEAAALKRNLKFYVQKHNDLERHFLETHGREAYREFTAEMDERNFKSLSVKINPHMAIKGQ